MTRGRKVDSSRIDQPDDQHIGEVEEEGYRFLGILLCDQTLNTKMKDTTTAEYIRRVKKLCRSKLNSGNLITGINAWAASVASYSVGVMDWTVEEVVNMDRNTRRILAIKGCLRTGSNVARLYRSAEKGREWVDWYWGVCEEASPCMDAWGMAQSRCCGFEGEGASWWYSSGLPEEKERGSSK